MKYERNELHKAKGDSKAMWDTIKSIGNLNTKTKNSTEKLLKICEDESKSVNYINNYFANVGQKLASSIQNATHSISSLQQSPVVNSQGKSLVILETDNDEVNSIIRNLKTGCAVGYDGIPVSVLKSVCHIITPIITHVCNLCITRGVFPNVFKKALVHPVFKSGCDTQIENYRPISVLSTFSKILEKILNNRLKLYLEKNKIIHNNQYGFSKGKSTEDAVLDFTNTLIGHLENKNKSIGVFLDLAKAFDTVSIPILLCRLEEIGVRGVALDIFQDYLTNRTQYVKIDEYYSDDVHLTYGVPQGSVLGPTLFLIYINSLCQLEIPNCKVLAYADDTVLIVHGDNWKTTCCLTERALHIVMRWLSCSLLTLNTAKTKCIAFSSSTSSQPCDLIIKAHNCTTFTQGALCACDDIKRVSVVKYLGVMVDCTLSWTKHIDMLVSRVRKLMYPFKKLRAVAELPLLRTVYYALAQSLLMYCIVVWGGTFKTALLRLERAQRAVLKVMLTKNYRYPTLQIYRDVQVLTVRQLFVQQVVLRRHCSLSYNPNILINKRHKYAVCPVIPTRLALSVRHYLWLGNKLYNLINKNCNIYPRTRSQCKNIVRKFLLEQSYETTENMFIKQV